jgi:hypothetical protein
MVALSVNTQVSLASASPSVVGYVTSPGKIRLQDVAIAMSGVLSWTLLSGDKLEVLGSPALVMLSNGTRVLIDPETTVRLEKHSSLTVSLVAGTVSVSCQAACGTAIEVNGRLLDVGVQNATRVSRRGMVITISRQIAVPVFSFPSSWLFKLFPYKTGIHLPQDQSQR